MVDNLLRVCIKLTYIWWRKQSSNYQQHLRSEKTEIVKLPNDKISLPKSWPRLSFGSWNHGNPNRNSLITYSWKKGLSVLHFQNYFSLNTSTQIVHFASTFYLMEFPPMKKRSISVQSILFTVHFCIKAKFSVNSHINSCKLSSNVVLLKGYKRKYAWTSVKFLRLENPCKNMFQWNTSSGYLWVWENLDDPKHPKYQWVCSC